MRALKRTGRGRVEAFLIDMLAALAPDVALDILAKDSGHKIDSTAVDALATLIERNPGGSFSERYATPGAVRAQATPPT